MSKKLRSNPIIDGRVVSSHTFAVRYLAHLCSLYPDYPDSSEIDSEEFEYLSRVGLALLSYQLETLPPGEKWYFENLSKDFQGIDDILKFITFRNPDYYRYLKKL